MPTPQIIAMGGGGFSMETGKSLLDQYILAQTGKPEPKIAFLATASGDSPTYILNFYIAASQLACRPSHLPFFGRTPDLRNYLLSQDVIYVGGGNTKSMLAVWREWGLPELLREAWHNGIVLAGLSAGAICWFQQGITDSFADKLAPMDCLGLLPGSCCPHYDSEAERRPDFRRMVAAGEALPGIALDDLAGAHFRGSELHRVVFANTEAHAYRLERGNHQAIEMPLNGELLPA